MWLIEFLPDTMVAFVIWIICIAGAVLWLGSKASRWLPGLSLYRVPMELFGVVLLAFAIYLQGGRANEAIWQQRVTELEKQVAEATAKAAEKNVEIQTKVVERVKVVKEKGDTIIRYVDREVVKNNEVIKYVENCPLPKSIIDAHNQAATLNQSAKGVKQ